MSNTRNNSDGFKGQCPTNGHDWAVKAYRNAGMEQPWLLEHADGKVIDPAAPHEDPANLPLVV